MNNFQNQRFEFDEAIIISIYNIKDNIQGIIILNVANLPLQI